MENGIVLDGNKNKVVNAQEWLNNNYPTKQKKAELQSLILLGKYARKISRVHVGTGFEQVTLEGELDLVDFTGLKNLVLNGQLINELRINHCSELESLVINSTDLLSELDISKKLKLVFLDCTDNASLVSPVGQSLEKKERKIKELKELLSKSREEIINYKIGVKESRLETFAQKLGIDRSQVRELRNAYQRLIKVCESGGSINDDEIEVIKDELLEKGVSIENTRKICRKSEKIAELRIEQEKFYQEKFEAQQEVPPR